MADHAVLSASGSHIWLACPPSVKLSENFPDTASFSASEGTFAHALAELELNNFFGNIAQSYYKKEHRKMTRNEFYSRGMTEYVDEYVQMVIQKYQEMCSLDNTTKVYIEQRLDFGRWVPGGFGTGDAVIVGNRTVEVCDLKYGKHVQVSAEGNSQLRLYGLGAYAEYDWLENIERIRMTICQPRCGGISSEELSAKELLEWGRKIVPVAMQAIKGEGEVNAGEHCRFCRAANRCKALADYRLSLAKYEFRNALLLSDEEVADILNKVDGLVSYANSIKDYALEEAVNGRRWPGYKLVEGRSQRKFSDEASIVQVLTAHGVEKEKLYKPRALIGITAMSSLIGKKMFDECLSQFVVRPTGRPTLVPEDDKRPEFSSAASDFTDLG